MRHIHVATGQDRGGRAVAFHLARHQRGKRDDRSALGHQSVRVIDLLHGAVNLRLRHEDDLVQQIAAHGEGQPVFQSDPATQAVGKACHLLDRDGMAGAQAFMHRRATVHADADDAQIGPGLFRGEGHARGQTAARKRDQQRPDVGFGRHDLSPDGGLPCDDGAVVEGGDLLQPLVRDQAVGFLLRVVLASAVNAHLGPERADAVHLGLGHEFGHADHRPLSGGARGPRHAAAVIAR